MNQKKSTWQLLNEEDTSYRNTVVFDFFQLVKFISVENGDDDYYYVYETTEDWEKTTYSTSAVVWPTYLKWNLPDCDYQTLENLYNGIELKITNRYKEKDFIKNNNTLVYNVNDLYKFIYISKNLFILEDLSWEKVEYNVSGINDSKIQNLIFIDNLKDERDRQRLNHWWDLNSSSFASKIKRKEPIILKTIDSKGNKFMLIQGYVWPEYEGDIEYHIKETLSDITYVSFENCFYKKYEDGWEDNDNLESFMSKFLESLRKQFKIEIRFK